MQAAGFRISKRNGFWGIALTALGLLFTAGLSGGCRQQQQPLMQQQCLNQGWMFRSLQDSLWYTARIPSTIHTDLQDAGLIPDPFYGCNEESLQWIGETSWVYRLVFTPDGHLLKKDNIELLFEGLDTYAEIWLNDRLLYTAGNMHRPHRIDLQKKLKQGENLLEVRFEPAALRFITDSLALGYPLPGGQWVFARKAAFHYGWDWGPRLITAGIYKPVKLIAWSKFRLRDAWIENLHIPLDSCVFDRATQQYKTPPVLDAPALLRLHAGIEADRDQAARLCISLESGSSQLACRTLQLKAGMHDYSLDFGIENPRLWWTNALGQAYLYDFVISVQQASGISDSLGLSHGIRRLELLRKSDKPSAKGLKEESFAFRLNGLPLYVKGANYIPLHSFQPRVRPEDYHNLIKTVLGSNMNMLRVWGGGLYEQDLFYELCDRNGILLWHDFMFACAMYPGDAHWMQNIEKEAAYQIRRLRSHASLALWCGNNESDEAWHNWGWHRRYSIQPEDSAKIWHDYQKLFHELLPSLVASLDPQRPYEASSPRYGWGRDQSLREGPAHYWGVWWGMQPFSLYLERIPRFMSEFGFQSLPSLAAIRQFQPPEEDSLYSAPLLCHQKHKTGYQTIDTYLKREELMAVDLPSLIYLSQLIQARGVGLGIEAHRRARPWNQGTLYWQLNDVWPVTSWSSVDFSGQWKGLQYQVRSLYEELVVSLLEKEGKLQAGLISDLTFTLEGDFRLLQCDFYGNCHTVFQTRHSQPALSSALVYEASLNSLAGDYHAHGFYLAEFEAEDYHISRLWISSPLGRNSLPDPHIHFRLDRDATGVYLDIESRALAAWVYLNTGETVTHFEDNFFHLLPGQPRRIRVNSPLTDMELASQLQITHLKEHLQSDK